MFPWNESTGALYLWDNVGFTDNGDGTGGISNTQYEPTRAPQWLPCPVAVKHRIH